MPIADFRQYTFNSSNIDSCGRYVGHQTYWKLYAIENLLRIVIHSVLSVQIPAGWWKFAVDGDIQREADRRRKNYLKKPGHNPLGSHDIYYAGLRDMNEILRANANLFYPVIPEMDEWLVAVEELRLNRNVVAHMNFPSRKEMKQIDKLYEDCRKLIEQIKTRVDLKVP